jgi:ribonuclease HI
MKSRLAGYTKNRLKRSSFVHEAKKLDRKLAPELTIPSTPLSRRDILDPLTNDLSGIKVKLDIPQLESGKQECENIKKSLMLAMINEDYPNDKWTHVYTDGSVTRAIKDGGAGILIIHPSGYRETHHMATGKHCSNFRAETEALMKAVSVIIDSSEAVSSVVFLTDARSVLEALINNKSPDLARAMNELSTICNVTIQWIPAHCGITGNEEADKLAKFRAQSAQPNVQKI